MPTKQIFEIYLNDESQGHILIPIHDIPKNSFFWDVVRERIETEIADMAMGFAVDHIDFGSKTVTLTEA